MEESDSKESEEDEDEGPVEVSNPAEQYGLI